MSKAMQTMKQMESLECQLIIDISSEYLKCIKKASLISFGQIQGLRRPWKVNMIQFLY